MPQRALGNEAAQDNPSNDYFDHDDQDAVVEADLFRTTYLGPTCTREIGNPFSLDSTVSEKPQTAGSERAALRIAPCTEAEKDHFHLAQGEYDDEGDSGLLSLVHNCMFQSAALFCLGIIL